MLIDFPRQLRTGRAGRYRPSVEESHEWLESCGDKSTSACPHRQNFRPNRLSALATLQAPTNARGANGMPPASRVLGYFTQQRLICSLAERTRVSSCT